MGIIQGVIWGLRGGYMGIIWGLYRGYMGCYWDNGKEIGNYYLLEGDCKHWGARLRLQVA